MAQRRLKEVGAGEEDNDSIFFFLPAIETWPTSANITLRTLLEYAAVGDFRSFSLRKIVCSDIWTFVRKRDFD
jgi:hypothetical protein